MSLENHWAAVATRVGTSPRQLALLLLSAVAAIGIFGAKLVMAPKAATASAPAAAPTTTVSHAPTESTTAMPNEFLGPMPRWNLLKTATRSPFAQPVPPQVAATAATTTLQAIPSAAEAGFTLQATLDGELAVLNGKTLRIGQSITDPKTGQRYQLMSVRNRAVTLSAGAQMTDLSMDISLVKDH